MANNPALCGLAAAREVFGRDNVEVRVLSVGTGSYEYYISGAASATWGPIGWMQHGLVDILTDTSLVDTLMRELCGENNYMRVNGLIPAKIAALDDTSLLNVDALKKMGDKWVQVCGDDAVNMLTRD